MPIWKRKVIRAEKKGKTGILLESGYNYVVRREGGRERERNSVRCSICRRQLP